MTDDTRRELDPDPLDVSEGLYHEAQADGVPYDESLEPFTTRVAEAQKLTRS